MRIHLEARWDQAALLLEQRKQLESMGFEVRTGWLDRAATTQDTVSDPALVPDLDCALSDARSDIEEVRSCDMLVTWTGGAGGAGGQHVLLGMAMAWEKRTVVIGAPEHMSHMLAHEKYPDWESFLVAMRNRRKDEHVQGHR